MKEVELRQEGEDVQPQLVRQKQPLGVLLISGCLGNKSHSSEARVDGNIQSRNCFMQGKHKPSVYRLQ